jgi:poly(A) polymerase
LAKALYYRQGPDAFRAAVLTAWARAAAEPASAPWRERLSLPDRFPRPMLPVRGSDVLALGVPPGPAVGRIVGDFESWWIEAGFPTDPDLVRRRLTELVIPHTGNHVRRRD